MDGKAEAPSRPSGGPASGVPWRWFMRSAIARSTLGMNPRGSGGTGLDLRWSSKRDFGTDKRRRTGSPRLCRSLAPGDGLESPTSVACGSDGGGRPPDVGSRQPSRMGSDDGDRPESGPRVQRRGAFPRPVVLRQGSSRDHGVVGGRGRRQGPRHGEVQGTDPAPRDQADRDVHLPVLRPGRCPLQAPLGDGPGRRRSGACSPRRPPGRSAWSPTRPLGQANYPADGGLSRASRHARPTTPCPTRCRIKARGRAPIRPLEGRDKGRDPGIHRPMPRGPQAGRPEGPARARGQGQGLESTVKGHVEVQSEPAEAEVPNRTTFRNASPGPGQGYPPPTRTGSQARVIHPSEAPGRTRVIPGSRPGAKVQGYPNQGPPRHPGKPGANGPGSQPDPRAPGPQRPGRPNPKDRRARGGWAARGSTATLHLAPMATPMPQAYAQQQQQQLKAQARAAGRGGGAAEGQAAARLCARHPRHAVEQPGRHRPRPDEPDDPTATGDRSSPGGTPRTSRSSATTRKTASFSPSWSRPRPRPPPRPSTPTPTATASRPAPAGSCSGPRPRRRSSSGWPGRDGSGSGGPRGKTTRPSSAGTTSPPGGSASTFAPTPTGKRWSWRGDAPEGGRPRASPTGWTWPSRWPSCPAWSSRGSARSPVRGRRPVPLGHADPPREGDGVLRLEPSRTPCSRRSWSTRSVPASELIESETLKLREVSDLPPTLPDLADPSPELGDRPPDRRAGVRLLGRLRADHPPRQAWPSGPT